MLKTGTQVFTDVAIDRKNLKDSLKARGRERLSDIEKKIAEISASQRGKGRKRKKANQNTSGRPVKRKKPSKNTVGRPVKRKKNNNYRDIFM